ncbi:SDR family oxidoreductase [Candidatus Microgenomates bacterium]|nr:SDR family oxidoreductase [Candidatus Microgenomates bacterium]
MFSLAGKVALVTGASSGIGEACGKILASQGAKVALTARRKDRLEKLAGELKQQGLTALPLMMDVTDKKQINEAVDQIIKEYGRLDILVNNAGVVDFVPFLEMSEESWDRVIDTNLKGCFLVAQKAAREMMKNKWGRIINISSVAMGGVGIGFPSIAHYCASKGGVVAFTESLADELAPLGILVNCVAPGLIVSEMTQAMVDDPEQMKGFLPKIPLKRPGTPEEIASAVVYLASDEASYTTGSTLVVDGGWLSD